MELHTLVGADKANVPVLGCKLEGTQADLS